MQRRKGAQRLVERTGPTGKWILGQGPAPSGYEKDLSYIQQVALYAYYGGIQLTRPK
ncbi:unnamed protein product [Pylaiella littoralis]